MQNGSHFIFCIIHFQVNIFQHFAFFIIIKIMVRNGIIPVGCKCCKIIVYHGVVFFLIIYIAKVQPYQLLTVT